MTKKTPKKQDQIPLNLIKMESKKILSKDKPKKQTPEQEELMDLLKLTPHIELVKTSNAIDRMSEDRDITELKCSVVWDGTLKILPYSGTQNGNGGQLKCTLSRKSASVCPFGNIHEGCTVDDECTNCEINTMSILTQLSALYIQGKKNPLDVRIEKKHTIITGRFSPTMETQKTAKQIDFIFPSMEPSSFVRQYTNGE